MKIIKSITLQNCLFKFSYLINISVYLCVFFIYTSFFHLTIKGNDRIYIFQYRLKDRYKEQLCLSFLINLYNTKIVKNNIIKHVINIIIE